MESLGPHRRQPWHLSIYHHQGINRHLQSIDQEIWANHPKGISCRLEALWPLQLPGISTTSSTMSTSTTGSTSFTHSPSSRFLGLPASQCTTLCVGFHFSASVSLLLFSSSLCIQFCMLPIIAGMSANGGGWWSGQGSVHGPPSQDTPYLSTELSDAPVLVVF